VRVSRLSGLLLVVALTGLFSGNAAGAGPTTSAVVSAAVGALPERFRTPAAAVPVAAAPGPPAAEAPPTAPAEPTTDPGSTTDAGPTTERSDGGTGTAEDAEERGSTPGLASGTPCRITAEACIELSSNRSWLLSGGEVAYGPVPVTHGRSGWRTPPGVFRVSFKNRDHVSSIFDAPMPYSVFFNGGIAFHEGSLSERSHGCIHLSRTAAREYFGALDPGDVVEVVA